MAVTELGPTRLKNIERSIRVYSLQIGNPAQAKPATEAKPPEPKMRSRLALLGAGIVALCIVIAGGAWHFVGANRSASVASTPSAEAAHLSIVVLPFTNLSGDPTQDLVSPTASLRTSPLIFLASAAPSSSRATRPLSSRARMPTPGRSARSLAFVTCWKVRCNATRTVFGSTHNSSTPRLAVISGQRFDKPLADLFDLQDEIVASLAGHNGGRVDHQRGSPWSRRQSRFDGSLFSGHGVVQTRGEILPMSLARAISLSGHWRLTPNVDAVVGMACADVQVATGCYVDGKAERLVPVESNLESSAVTVAKQRAGALLSGRVEGPDQAGGPKALRKVSGRWR